MSFRGYGDLFTCIQFRCNNSMPATIYKACLKTETVSQTRYVQEAVAARLSADLDIPLQELLDLLPPPRSRAAHLFRPEEASKNPNRIGSANTVEEVK